MCPKQCGGFQEAEKIASSQPSSQSSNSLRPSPAIMATVSKSKAVPLNHKQLKAIQNLISGASYFSVLESNAMAGVKIRERYYMYYYGYDDDHPGFLRLFLAGNGRFRVLWDDDRIISGLGYISGISKATCKAILGYSTLSKKNLLNGRQIHEKAKAALMEAKKLLAYWMEFLVNDQMPSGKDEEDALKYVIRRAREETSVELVDDDEEPANDGLNTQEETVKEEIDYDEADNDEEEPDNEDTNIKREDVDSDPDFFDSEEDEKPIVEKTVSAKKTVRESTFLPAALLLFILYGPFGVAAYGLEISSALSMDTVGIDEQAGAKKSMTQVSIRQSEKKDQDRRR